MDRAQKMSAVVIAVVDITLRINYRAIIAAVSRRDFNSDGFACDYGITSTIRLI